MTLEDLYPFNQSPEILKTLLEIIKIWIASGEDILICGFGKFCVKDKGEKQKRLLHPMIPGCGRLRNFTRTKALKGFIGQAGSRQKLRARVVVPRILWSWDRFRLILGIQDLDGLLLPLREGHDAGGEGDQRHGRRRGRPLAVVLLPDTVPSA
jgi:hypothetical protein